MQITRLGLGGPTFNYWEQVIASPIAITPAIENNVSKTLSALSELSITPSIETDSAPPANAIKSASITIAGESNVAKTVFSTLQNPISVAPEIDAAKTLMNIYSATGDTEKYKAMKAKVDALIGN